MASVSAGVDPRPRGKLAGSPSASRPWDREAELWAGGASPAAAEEKSLLRWALGTKAGQGGRPKGHEWLSIILGRHSGRVTCLGGKTAEFQLEMTLCCAPETVLYAHSLKEIREQTPPQIFFCYIIKPSVGCCFGILGYGFQIPNQMSVAAPELWCPVVYPAVARLGLVSNGVSRGPPEPDQAPSKPSCP